MKTEHRPVRLDLRLERQIEEIDKDRRRHARQRQRHRLRVLPAPLRRHPHGRDRQAEDQRRKEEELTAEVVQDREDAGADRQRIARGQLVHREVRRPLVGHVPRDDRHEQDGHARDRQVRVRSPKPDAVFARDDKERENARSEQDGGELRVERAEGRDPEDDPPPSARVLGDPHDRQHRQRPEEHQAVIVDEKKRARGKDRQNVRQQRRGQRPRPIAHQRNADPIDHPRRDGRQQPAARPQSSGRRPEDRREEPPHPGDHARLVVVAEREAARPTPVVRLVRDQQVQAHVDQAEREEHSERDQPDRPRTRAQFRPAPVGPGHPTRPGTGVGGGGGRCL